MTEDQRSHRAPKRPMLRYFGGKFKIAPWVISHFPKHKIYVEPFGGAGSVLLSKPRCQAEVYNDINGEIVNVFRMARDRGPELKEALRLTPFSRDEHALSFSPSPNALEQARRTIIRSWMSFSSSGLFSGGHKRSGFRVTIHSRKGTAPSMEWMSYGEAFEFLIERLRGVCIENDNAIPVMRRNDTPSTLHYVDPPYVMSTRRAPDKGYNHELSDEQHIELARFLHSLQGYVIISGYKCDLYADLYKGWASFHRETQSQAGTSTLETIWVSPNSPGRKGTLI